MGAERRRRRQVLQVELDPGGVIPAEEERLRSAAAEPRPRPP